MSTLPTERPERNPVVAALAELIGDALMIAAERPDVIAAARRMLVGEAARASAEPSPLLAKVQLARALAVSVATIDRHDRAGAPYEQVGARRRYDLAARRTWLAARGRVGFTPAKSDATADAEVEDLAARAGLRVVEGGR